MKPHPVSADGVPSPLGTPQRVVLAAAAVAYPLLLILGTTRWEEDTAAAAFLGLAAALGTLALFDARARPAAVGMMLPATVLGVGTLLLSGDALMLAFPTLVSFALALPFAWSLRSTATPLLVHFARIHRERLGRSPVLPPGGRAHCLRFTRVWTATLIANGLLAAALAVFADRAVWAAYACGISYGLLGLLHFVESRLRPRDSEAGEPTSTDPLQAGDPWFAGHFDGDPILPAVAQLALVEEALRHRFPDARLGAIHTARFRRPIRPGMALTVACDPPDDECQTKFRVLADGEVASHGVVRVEC